MSWLKSKPSKNSQTSSRSRDGWARLGRVYILPTKFGGAFTLGAIFMLLIGSAYQNNLVNLLGFFMLAILFTAMIATHANINGVEITRVESVHGFAGENFPVSIVVKNTGRQPKSNCDFTVRGFKKIAQYDARLIIPPQSDARLLASFEAPARGLHALSRFSLSTTAPFGLFRAWVLLPSEAIATIYPRRLGDLTWNEEPGFDLGQGLRTTGAEDYKEHRAYQTGDNLKRVDWNAFARGRPLMTKEFDEPSGQGLHFDFQKLLALEQEKRLEQIAKWIDLAIQKGIPFTVSLPGQRLGPDRGLGFAHRAWGELARFESRLKDRA